jgi:sugar/nucleoside kinase (ribokinase family)
MPTAVDYLLIGHATADLTPQGRFLGGTVSYAARTAHAFGLRVGVLTSGAKDEPLLKELAPYATVISLDAAETTTFENIYLPEGRIQYLRGRADLLTLADVPQEWRSAHMVHLGPLDDEVDPSIAESFSNATTLLTLQGLLRRWDADGRVHFRRWHNPEALKRVDLVVFSEEDIIAAPDLEHDFAGSVEHLFVTRADKGGTYYHNGQAAHYATPQVEVINPTGAGDVFAAALLCTLHLLKDQPHRMQRATQVAAQLAATSVTRFTLEGTPTPDEVKAALEAAKPE